MTNENHPVDLQSSSQMFEPVRLSERSALRLPECAAEPESRPVGGDDVQCHVRERRHDFLCEAAASMQHQNRRPCFISCFEDMHRAAVYCNGPTVFWFDTLQLS